MIKEYANLACARADSSVIHGRSQLLRRSRGRNLGPTTHPRRCTARQLTVTVPVWNVHRHDDIHITTIAGQLQDWDEDVMLALYADDSAYLSSSRRADLDVAKLERVPNLLSNWLDNRRVAINVTKTAALLTGQQRIMPPKLRLQR
ncbi:hypothetical protein EVAR_33705_1 [Eumeta japonica]|uniref:Reverse transcriptase domain-containing protein n=1 Tax=Eumeta variegata TaxID=151549 RepID=A0A4C1VV18_EUMVA|nr:hypothetical protein EVAR_33705_1 [Eumeta japonica]